MRHCHHHSLATMSIVALALVLGNAVLDKDAVLAQDAGAGDKKTTDQADAIRKILDSASGTDEGLLPAPAPQVESDPEAIALVDRYLESIGGLETLRAVTDRSTKFSNTKFSPTGETEAVIALFLKEGYMYREEWEIKGFEIGNKKLAFVQIYNGDLEEGWVKMFDTISPLEGRTLSVFVWDKYLGDFFLHWKEDGYTLHMAGKGLVDGDPCSIVRVLDFSQRNPIRYFFSDESGRLLKKEWIDTTQKDPAKKEQYYKMYRPIEFSDNSGKRILFPVKLEIMVDGDLDTERVYSGVQFNSKLAGELFAQPEGTPFDERARFGDGEEIDESVPLPEGVREAHGHGGRRRPTPTPVKE